MKRRSFLQGAGLLVTGGAEVLAGRARATGAALGADDRLQRDLQTVLVTSAETDLAQAVAGGLRDAYRVRLTGPSGGAAGYSFTRSALGEDETTDTLVRGIDAIVHVAEPPAGATETERADCRTRLTYNLLLAASRQGVRRVVYLSSLAMMTGYDEDFRVDESWRPRPIDEAHGLSHYLGEYTCREFAREAKLNVVVLRLGRVMPAGTAAAKRPEPPWFDQRDVVQAVARALDPRPAAGAPALGPWEVFHVASGGLQSRFPAARAERLLGYRAQRAE